MFKSAPRRKLLRLEQSFHLDGNTKTFHPPEYEPLLDQHLKPFFYNHDRIRILQKNKLINRKFRVIDDSINKKFLNDELMARPSLGMTKDKGFRTVTTISAHISPTK